VYSTKEWDMIYPYITNLFDFNFKKTRSAFIGAVGGHFTGNSFISWSSEGVTKIFNKPLILDVNLPLDKMIQELNEFQPTILGGYFNALKVLAQKQEEGILEINPRTMTNCGEGINAKQKEYIERVFDAPMTNLYGFAECFILGFGKDEFDGIYLRDDICLVEVKEDHLLITNLVNKTEPLIRYKINDYVKLKEDKKKLYPFTLIDNIVGREEFVLWFENDIGEMDFIHPLIFTDFYVKGLHQLQIAITSKTTFEFRAVIDSTEKEQVKNKIREKLDIILKEKNFTNVIYTIKEYDEIPVDEKTGKFRLIINE
jgi:phenylacetate-coenzyme A ligase PaaK-like adenylate-forming protein